LNISEKLYSVSNEEYGGEYNSHVIEIYKLYVEMADRISTRRQSANSFFLSINTAIVAIVGYVQLGQKVGEATDFYWVVGLAGVALCYTWYRLIRSYRGLNSGKFKVIHEIEKLLPLSPYDAEWEVIGRGKDSKLYLPFTRVETAVPWVFLVLHLLVVVHAMPWRTIGALLTNTP